MYCCNFVDPCLAYCNHSPVSIYMFLFIICQLVCSCTSYHIGDLLSVSKFLSILVSEERILPVGPSPAKTVDIDRLSVKIDQLPEGINRVSLTTVNDYIFVINYLQRVIKEATNFTILIISH